MGEIRLLPSLSDAELGALEQRCRWRRAGPGQQIPDRSSDDRDVFFVASGSVCAVDFSPSGREVVHAVIAAGGHFGELSAFDGMERSACPAVPAHLRPRALAAGTDGTPSIHLQRGHVSLP